MSLTVKTPDPKTPDPKSRQLESGKLKLGKKRGGGIMMPPLSSGDVALAFILIQLYVPYVHTAVTRILARLPFFPCLGPRSFKSLET